MPGVRGDTMCTQERMRKLRVGKRDGERKMNIEHRTSNVQHRILKPQIRIYLFLFSAVLILATNIFINSSVSARFWDNVST